MFFPIQFYPSLGLYGLTLSILYNIVNIYCAHILLVVSCFSFISAGEQHLYIQSMSLSEDAPGTQLSKMYSTGDYSSYSTAPAALVDQYS